jgi:hypothetical protein
MYEIILNSDAIIVTASNIVHLNYNPYEVY